MLLNKGRCKNCMLFLGLSEVIWEELHLSSPADNINLSHRLQKLNFLAREMSLPSHPAVFSVSLGQPYSSPQKLPTSFSLFPELWIAPIPAAAPYEQDRCIEGNLGNPIYPEANQRAPCHVSTKGLTGHTDYLVYVPRTAKSTVLAAKRQRVQLEAHACCCYRGRSSLAELSHAPVPREDAPVHVFMSALWTVWLHDLYSAVEPFLALQ